MIDSKVPVAWVDLSWEPVLNEPDETFGIEVAALVPELESDALFPGF